jgi:hypothetical protein
MAAGAFEADHVPVLDDFDLIRTEYGGARLAACGADTHTEQVGALAAAGEFPGAVDLPTALYRLGGLQREQAAGEHQVRAVGIDFSQGFWW